MVVLCGLHILSFLDKSPSQKLGDFFVTLFREKRLPNQRSEAIRMNVFSRKQKTILKGVVVDGFKRDRGWRVKMTGGVFWFALAASAGAQFQPGDLVQAIECVDDSNRLRISHLSI